MMLFVLGKVKKNSTITGYRVLDVALRPTLPKLGNAIINSTIKTLDVYNILKILYSRDGNKYYRFVNARLGYSISESEMYYLCTNGSNLAWGKYIGGHYTDFKYIPDYTTISFDRLSLEGLEGSLSAYGTYGERYPIYVIIAEYKDEKGNSLGYIVADSNSESNSLEFLPPQKLIEKVRLREEKAGVKCIANAYLREGTIVAKSKFNETDSFVTIHICPEGTKVNNQQANVQAQQRAIFQQQQEIAKQQAIKQQQAARQQTAQPEARAVQPTVRPNVPTAQTAPVGDGVSYIPAELTELKKGQLMRKPLTKLVVHEKVTSISPDSLLLCPNFALFEVSKSNLHMCSPGGLLMSKDGTTLLRCPSSSTLDIKQIPNYIRVIAKGAFRGCQNLRTVTIPSTVQRIEAGAFCCVPNLTTVICYAKEICEDAFTDCPNLEVLVLGFGVQKIAGTIVRNSPKLKVLVLPDSVQAITPKKYAAMTEKGYEPAICEHKLIEEYNIRYVFAPNTPQAKQWVLNLYTDERMYSTEPKRFKYATNSLNNLRSYNLMQYEQYIR